MIQSRSWQIFFCKRSGDRQRDTVDYIDFVYLTTTKMYCISTKVALNNMQVANIQEADWIWSLGYYMAISNTQNEF